MIFHGWNLKSNIGGFGDAVRIILNTFGLRVECVHCFIFDFNFFVQKGEILLLNDSAQNKK